MKNFILLIVVILTTFSVEAVERISGDLLFLRETSVPSRCKDGELRLDTSDDLLKKCSSNSWSSYIDDIADQIIDGVKTFEKEFVMQEIAEPANPSAGYQKLYIDTLDSKLKTKDSSGSVTIIGNADESIILLPTTSLRNVIQPSEYDKVPLTLKGKTSPGGMNPIVWTSVVNMNVVSNTITKTGTAGWNAGAISTAQITTATNGSVEWTITDSTKLYGVGLSTSDPDQQNSTIEFNIYNSGGAAQVWESGSAKYTFTGGAPVNGDTHKVSVESNVVKYYKNTILQYTSLITPTYPLFVDTAFHTVGGTLTASMTVDGFAQLADLFLVEDNDGNELMSIDKLGEITAPKVTVNGRLEAVSTTESSHPCPDQTQLQINALTPTLGDCVNNTDSNEYQRYDGSLWKSIGGGGGSAFNLLLNGALEDELVFTCNHANQNCANEITSIWNNQNGSAGDKISASIATVYDAELCITNSEWNGKELQVSCMVKSSASEINFCGSDDSGSGDVCVDILNLSGWQRMTTIKVASVSGKICARLTSDSVITTDAFLDDCEVTERKPIIVSIDTEWTSFTPSWDNIATTTTLVQAIWRRRGENMEIIVIIESGANDGIASGLKMLVPNGESIDTVIIGSSGTAEKWVGIETYWNDGGTTLNKLNSLVDTTNNKLTWSKENGTGFDGLDFNNTDTLKIHASIPIANWSSNSGVVTQKSDFLIDANIGGANPSLGTSAIDPYQGIDNSSLDLVQNSLSSPVGIACSSTNENDVGDLTCSAGNEQIGIVFNYSGRVKACVSFNHRIQTDATGFVTPYFQVVKTANNSQTVDDEGNVRIGGNNDESTSLSSHASDDRVICGKFRTTGKTTLRLFYEQSVSATITTNAILADRDGSSGQRDIHWSVVPLSGVIVGEFNDHIKTPGSGINQTLVSASISATEVITEEDDNFIGTCTDADPSVCTFTGSYWSTDPKCWCDEDICEVQSDSSVSATINRSSSASSFKLFCIGNKNL